MERRVEEASSRPETMEARGGGGATRGAAELAGGNRVVAFT